MTEHFWLGMALIFLGGAMNGCFPLPMKYARWKWENTWLAFTFFALLALPWILAGGFVPDLRGVYSSVPSRALLLPLTFGFFWGIAQVTFGLGISAVGMALAFSVVAGLSCLSGALIPLLVLSPGDLLRPRGLLLLVSMPILFAGLALYGAAGRRREREQATPNAATSAARSFAVGLGICIFTGIFGSNINLGFAFGGDVQRSGLAHGASTVTSTYAVWALVLGAGFIPNLVYCLYLLVRDRHYRLFAEAGRGREVLLAGAMAVLWLGGMVTYGIGATLVGKYGTSLGYTLLIAAMILASNSLGLLTGEWKGTSSGTRRLLAAGAAVVLVSVVVLNLGGLF
ncbi:MAG: L-rhamnose/proton symporter RhaT [Terriglobia bacterium]